MYALQKPKYRFPEDYQYFCRLDVDDSVVFVRRKSPLQRLEDLVAEAKKRTVNVAVSRLPHPGVDRHARARQRHSRRNSTWCPTAAATRRTVAVLNGEVDCGALPIAGVASLGDQMRMLGVFNDEPPSLAQYSEQRAVGEQGVRHQAAGRSRRRAPGRSTPR